MSALKEFFGWDGYAREPEGYLSWQHLLFVTLLMAVMVALAVYLGLTHRQSPERQKRRILVVAAILLDSLELFKILLFCIRGQDPLAWLYELPLFLCSIQLITVPLSAFSRGRTREAALDFVFIFGVLGAVLGTYGAGQNYGAYPVLSFDNMVSGITHTISGFCALYIVIAGLASMKRKNIPITFGILAVFCAAAYSANLALDYNYMFMMSGDGTPYDLVYNLVDGSPVLYPLAVVALFLAYISAFYGVFYLLARHRRADSNDKASL